MRLLIVAKLEGHISEAAHLAMQRGAKVSQTETVDQALAALRGKQSADLVMIDVGLEISRLIKSLEQERISTTVVACRQAPLLRVRARVLHPAAPAGRQHVFGRGPVLPVEVHGPP